MVCKKKKSFCIVPSLRGPEKSRRIGDIVHEVQGLVADGVVEVTLLGQNVNSYGRDQYGRAMFADLLRALGEVGGLERVRFTSPHPRDFTLDVLEAMGDVANVCEHLHLPLQSGSDRVLKAMRRSYRQARYLDLVARAREMVPGCALTTDIIVGFPGETEEDFQATLDVVRQARFSGAFTFQYSKRPGTPAADLPDQLPKDVVQERYDRLVELQNEIAWEENKRLVGQRVELLVATGEGRKDAETQRMSGRARDGRLVHFTPRGDAVDGEVRPGDIVETTITYGAPHHLVADADILSHRRTTAGDNAEAGRRPRTDGIEQVGLGMPAIGAQSTPEPATGGCSVC